MSIGEDRLQTRVQCVSLVVLLTLLVSFGLSQPATAQVLANSTPRFIENAQDLGPEDSSKQIAVTVWLKLHNKPEFDETVRQMYDRTSSQYHRWLTRNEYEAKFSPTAQDALTVRNFLAAHNLKVSAIDRDNHFVTAQGKIADVQNAFQVQINRFMVRGEVHRGNTSDVRIGGAAGALVSSVQGLSDLTFQSYVRRPIDPGTGAPFPFVPLTAVGPDGSFFSRNCWRSPETDTFVTPGGGPTATYTGNRYGSDIDSKPPNLAPCGYNPLEVQTAYGLPAVYKKWRGKGQTIIIVDAYGSPTIRADANTFSQVYHLPALTTKNFAIVKIGGPTGCTPAEGCSPTGWDVETSLDVEWAHAIAPAANILLIQAFDNTFSNLDQAVLYAAEGAVGAGGAVVNFGNVISNSYGAPENGAPLVELNVQNSINEFAAAFGISANFSTGDDGDFSTVPGVQSPTVSNPASTQFATAVGGTSLFINKDKTINFQTGWGNNITRIADVTPNPPVVPPLLLGFDGGGGGGTSAVFSKPSFQMSLSGGNRKLPDISFIADDFTGVEIIFQQSVGVVGGTSVACPTFSAFWALANQAAGAPLGQAAALLYELPAGAITDIRQIGSATNPSGVITNPPFKPIRESAKSLVQPLQNTKNFVSAIYNSPFSTRWFVLSFGTDTSLTTGVGWDNVTGLGTPNGLKFVQGVLATASANSGAVAH